MEKYYLIGAFNHGEMAQHYFDSLPVLGDAVEPIYIQYQRKNAFEPVKTPENVKLIKYQKEYAGNTGKHKDFRELIAPLLERDTWVIFTDMHDVLFQAPLPILPEKETIVTVSESKKFGEINYWRELFPENVFELEVFNIGTFAMKRDTLLAFWDYLYEGWSNFYRWYKTGSLFQVGDGITFPFAVPRFHQQFRIELAILFNGHYDTLAYNKFLRTQQFVEMPGLFGCYAYQVETGRIEDRMGKLYQNDKLISVAHFNGASKQYQRKYIQIC